MQKLKKFDSLAGKNLKWLENIPTQRETDQRLKELREESEIKLIKKEIKC